MKKIKKLLPVLFVTYLVMVALTRVQIINMDYFTTQKKVKSDRKFTVTKLNASWFDNKEKHKDLLENTSVIRSKFVSVNEDMGKYYINAIADYDTAATVYLKFEITSSQFSELAFIMPSSMRLTGDINEIIVEHEFCDISCFDEEEMLYPVDRVLMRGKCYNIHYL